MKTSDRLRVFYTHMLGFDRGPILVLYDDLTNTFTYYQGNKIEVAPYINNLYFPVKNRYNILTEYGYSRLMENLEIYLKNDYDKDETIVTNLDKGEISFYRTVYKNRQFCAGPELLTNIKFVSITNRFLVKLILWFGDKHKTRIFKRYIKFDKFNRRNISPNKEAEEIKESNPVKLDKLNDRQ